LTASAGVAGWAEFLLLRRSLDRRIGRTRLSAVQLARLWIPALLGGAAGWGALQLLDDRFGTIATAVLVLLPFGIVYLGGTWALGVPLARRLVSRSPLS
jgi:putative peptidoglycan lipid II flippase